MRAPSHAKAAGGGGIEFPQKSCNMRIDRNESIANVPALEVRRLLKTLGRYDNFSVEAIQHVLHLREQRPRPAVHAYTILQWTIAVWSNVYTVQSR